MHDYGFVLAPRRSLRSSQSCGDARSSAGLRAARQDARLATHLHPTSGTIQSAGTTDLLSTLSASANTRSSTLSEGRYPHDVTVRASDLQVPTWATIAVQIFAGLALLALAISKATIYWDLTEKHDEGLLLAALAAVGGLSLGVAYAGIRRRISARA